MEPTSRRRWPWLAALLTPALLALSARRERPKTGATRPRVVARAEGPAARPALPIEPLREPPAGSPLEAPPRREVIRVVERALLAEVSVEPREPCRDEDVTVRLRAPDGVSDVKFFVNGRGGNPVVLRFPAEGERALRVVARDWGAGVQRRAVTVRVRDCGRRETLALATERFRDGRVMFRVAQTSLDASTLRLRWDFGDGAAEEGGAARVHDYGRRPQDATQSTFVVRAEARDASGRTARATTSVAFSNPAYIARRMGTPFLPVRAPLVARVAQGYAEATLEVDNLLEEGVHLDGVTVRGFSCRAGEEPVETEVAPRDVLDAYELDAGARRAVAFRFPMRRFDRAVCRLGVTLSGHLPDGTEVRAPFAVDTGSGGDVVPVRDPSLQADLLRAVEILGDRPITPEDLRRLRAEGRL